MYQSTELVDEMNILKDIGEMLVYYDVVSLFMKTLMDILQIQ